MAEEFPLPQTVYYPKIPFRLTPVTDLFECPIRERPFQDYLGDFNIVDRDHLLPGFFQSLSSQDPAIVLDLMGSKRALVTLRQKYQLQSFKGAVVRFQTPNDETVNSRITPIDGDLCDQSTFEKVNDWLGNAKAHLIMERGIGGPATVPTDIRYVRIALHFLWEALAPEGIMLLQLPPIPALRERNIPVEEWLKKLKERKIYHQYVPSYYPIYLNNHNYLGLLMLKKTNDQPLPFI